MGASAAQADSGSGGGGGEHEGSGGANAVGVADEALQKRRLQATQEKNRRNQRKYRERQKVRALCRSLAGDIPRGRRATGRTRRRCGLTQPVQPAQMLLACGRQGPRRAMPLVAQLLPGKGVWVGSCCTCGRTAQVFDEAGSFKQEFDVAQRQTPESARRVLL